MDKGPYSQSYGFSNSHVRKWELDHKEGWTPKNWCFWIVVLEKTWESPGLQGDQISQFGRKLTLNIDWNDWCWSWVSNSLATPCEELTHWKRPWCWKRLRAGGEGDEDGMVGWHHWLNGHEFEQTPGDSEGQGSLACCNPWSCSQTWLSDWTTTEANKCI